MDNDLPKVHPDAFLTKTDTDEPAGLTAFFSFAWRPESDPQIQDGAMAAGQFSVAKACNANEISNGEFVTTLTAEMRQAVTKAAEQSCMQVAFTNGSVTRERVCIHGGEVGARKYHTCHGDVMMLRLP